jgi:hypothetical protein
MSKFRFVRKNGKVLGPLASDRIDQLFTEGKLASGDELGESQGGPWQSVAMLQQRIAEIKKKKLAEVEKTRTAQHAVTTEVPEFPTLNQASRPAESFDAINLFDTPPMSAGVSEFSDPLANAGTFTSPGYAPMASPFPLRSTSSDIRAFERNSEALDSTNPWRWIFPWKWETDTQPYPMLVVYLKFSQAVLKLFYLLFMLLGVVLLCVTGLSTLLVEDDTMSEEPLLIKFISTLIGIPLLAVLWWLVGQLIYIAGMASIDALRCFLAIERNTRK